MATKQSTGENFEPMDTYTLENWRGLATPKEATPDGTKPKAKWPPVHFDKFMEKPDEFKAKEPSGEQVEVSELVQLKKTPNYDLRLNKILPVLPEGYQSVLNGEEPCLGIMENLQIQLGREVMVTASSWWEVSQAR